MNTKLNLNRIRPGDFITRKRRIDGGTDMSWQGVPQKVTAVSLPFIYGDIWNYVTKEWSSSEYYIIDTRQWEVMRVSKNTAA